MKKSIILMSAALAMAFTACQDDTSDLGTMQKNEAPVVVASNGVATAFVVDQNLNLNNYQNVNLPVLEVAMNSEFPESAVLAGAFQISATEDFAKYEEITYSSVAVSSTKADDAVENATRKYQAVVEGNQVENAFVALFGKSPATQECWVRYNVYIQDGDQANILEYEGQQWWPAHKLNVTPVDLKLDIAESYTLFGPFIGNGTPEEGIVMLHGDAHQYDDPIFTAIFSVTDEQAEAGYTLQIFPTGNSSKVYGVAKGFEADAMAGRLELGGTPLKIKEAGPYKIEVNMETLMYSISLAINQLYVPCSGNNWNFTRSCQTLLTSDYINYSGFAFIDGSWALTSQPNTLGSNFVNGGAEGVLKLDDSKVLNADNGLAKPGNKGLYWVDANILKLTYSTTRIETLGVCGELNGWGASQDIALKAKTANPTAYSVWEGDVTFENAGQWKIRANNDWAINLGGTPENLVKDGGNLSVDEPGTYHIKVNVSAHPWTIEVTKK